MLGNIYLMIPMEERRRFSRCLAKVGGEGETVSGELSVSFAATGPRRVYTAGSQGGPVRRGKGEYQSVCIDVTERYLTKRMSQTDQYVKVLSNVYDKIFEYDFINQTVRYVSRKPLLMPWEEFKDIPMEMEEATARWIERSVSSDDRGAVKNFFRHILDQQAHENAGRPAPIEYRAPNEDGRDSGLQQHFFEN